MALGSRCYVKGHPRPQNPPKEGVNQVPGPKKITHSDFYILSIGLPMDHINTPTSRVSYPNVENPKYQADQFWASLPKIQNTTYYIHYILDVQN